MWLYKIVTSTINTLHNGIPPHSEDQECVGDLCLRGLLLPSPLCPSYQFLHEEPGLGRCRRRAFAGSPPYGCEGHAQSRGVPCAGDAVQNLISQIQALQVRLNCSPLPRQSYTTVCSEATLQVFVTG